MAEPLNTKTRTFEDKNLDKLSSITTNKNKTANSSYF